MRHTPKPYRAGCIIHVDYASLLLVETKTECKWGFPKGHCEKLRSINHVSNSASDSDMTRLDWEDDWTCAQRETYEETGLTIDAYQDNWVKENITFFICHIDSHIANTSYINDVDEIGKLRVISIDDILKLPSNVLSRPLRMYIIDQRCMRHAKRIDGTIDSKQPELSAATIQILNMMCITIVH